MNGSRMKDMEWIMNDKQARSKFQGTEFVVSAWMPKKQFRGYGVNTSVQEVCCNLSYCLKFWF